MKRAWSLMVGAVSLCLFTGRALAQQPVEPDGDKQLAIEWADKAKERFDKGDYSGTIDAIREAQKHARPPTFMMLSARSHEKLGKLIEARRLYKSVAEAQLSAGAPVQWVAAQEEARKNIAALEPRLPRLRLTVLGADVSVVVVTMDGAVFDLGQPGQATLVDPGVHTIAVKAPGFQEVTKQVELMEASTEEAVVQLMPAAPVTNKASIAPPPAPSPSSPAANVGAPTDSSSRSIRTAGYVALGVGGAGLVVGAITGGLAFGMQSDLRASCGASDFDAHRCREDRASGVSNALAVANASTGAFVAGGVGLAVGATLLLVSREKGPTIEVSLSPELLTLRGVF